MSTLGINVRVGCFPLRHLGKTRGFNEARQVESTGLYLLGTFGLVALGSGGIKPNVCTMGANQFEPCPAIWGFGRRPVGWPLPFVGSPENEKKSLGSQVGPV